MYGVVCLSLIDGVCLLFVVLRVVRCVLFGMCSLVCDVCCCMRFRY